MSIQSKGENFILTTLVNPLKKHTFTIALHATTYLRYLRESQLPKKLLYTMLLKNVSKGRWVLNFMIIADEQRKEFYHLKIFD